MMRVCSIVFVVVAWEKERKEKRVREQCIIDIVHDLLEEVKFGSKLIEEVEN